MPTILYIFTCILYIFIQIDLIICYHSKIWGMTNSVYLSAMYINVVASVSYTKNIARGYCICFLLYLTNVY